MATHQKVAGDNEVDAQKRTQPPQKSTDEGTPSILWSNVQLHKSSCRTEDHYQMTSLSWSFLDRKAVRFEPGLSSFGGVRFSGTKRKSDNEHWLK
jgi:hypothetical protein